MTYLKRVFLNPNCLSETTFNPIKPTSLDLSTSNSRECMHALCRSSFASHLLTLSRIAARASFHFPTHLNSQSA